MKNLADLKRTCHLYKWKLKYNSWFKDVPAHQSDFRTISEVTRRGFYLNTYQNGELTKSFCDFPKAKELEILQNENGFTIKIKRPDEYANHMMVYEIQQYIY